MTSRKDLLNSQRFILTSLRNLGRRPRRYRNNLNFSIWKKPRFTDYTCCIFNEHFMTSKKVQSLKIIVFIILKSILSTCNRFHLYVSWRRLEDVKIHWVALYTERGCYGNTLVNENYSFSLFLHEWLYRLRDVVVAANLVFAFKLLTHIQRREKPDLISVANVFKIIPIILSHRGLFMHHSPPHKGGNIASKYLLFSRDLGQGI